MPVIESKEPIYLTNVPVAIATCGLARTKSTIFSVIVSENVKPGAIGRADDDVRAGASGARLHVVQHAVADADQRQNQRDLDANGEDA